MEFVNYCGKCYPSDSPIVPVGSRGLKYGDGIFETTLFSSGKPVFWQEHMNRLQEGIETLKISDSTDFSANHLLKDILELAEKNKATNAIVRIQIFRGAGRLSQNSSAVYMIEMHAYSDVIEKESLSLTIYRDAIKTYDKFSHLKHCNYLPYVMGALYAREKGFDEALIKNAQDKICDSTRANIFIIKENEIYTPSLNEGCIAGIFRTLLIKQLPALGFNINELPIEESFLMNADEIFMTNSVRGIMPVGSIDGKSFKTDITQKIAEAFSIKNF